MNFALQSCTIFVTLAGSRAHGTSGPDSDFDLRGVCIAPKNVRLSPFQSFEQYEGPLPEGFGSLLSTPGTERTEVVIYDVTKFVSLLAVQNPTALEILFADVGDWLLSTPAWVRLHAARHLFLTQRIRQTYAGYAAAQLDKIRTHRSWLLSPPQAPPTRSEFGLPEQASLPRDVVGRIESAVQERLSHYHFDDLPMPGSTRMAVRERTETLLRQILTTHSMEETDDALTHHLSTALLLPEAVVETLKNERRYRTALRHWHAFQSHQTHRNPARAELERRFGYDTKHAMHLVRLYRMGVEALERGELLVRRPDAEELLAIRAGALNYEELLRQTQALEERMAQAVQQSILPEEADLSAIEALLLDLLAESLQSPSIGENTKGNA